MAGCRIVPQLGFYARSGRSDRWGPVETAAQVVRIGFIYRVAGRWWEYLAALALLVVSFPFVGVAAYLLLPPLIQAAVFG